MFSKVEPIDAFCSAVAVCRLGAESRKQFLSKSVAGSQVSPQSVSPMMIGLMDIV
jgi:hypothetical protein